MTIDVTPSSVPASSPLLSSTGSPWSRKLRYVTYHGLGESVERVLVVAATYEVALSDISLERGRHVYSITLTPFETVDLEIFRTSRREEDVSKERSTEETMFLDLATSLVAEKILYSDFKMTSEEDSITITEALRHEDVPLFSTNANDVKTGYEWAVGALSRSMEAATGRTATLNAAREDIVISVRTSQDAGSRSVRRLTNQNPCRTLRYDHYQLMKRIRIQVGLVGLQFATVATQGDSVEALIDASPGSGGSRSDLLTEFISRITSRRQPEPQSEARGKGLLFMSAAEFVDAAGDLLAPIDRDSIASLLKDIKETAKKLESDRTLLAATHGVDVVPVLGVDTACEPAEERMRDLREQLLQAQVDLTRRQSAIPPT